MVNIGHNWTPIQYTQRKYINFIHIKAETLSNLCSHDYYFILAVEKTDRSVNMMRTTA